MRDADVRCRRHQAAARVVVSQDHARGAKLKRAMSDFAKVEGRMVYGSLAQDQPANQEVVGVEKKSQRHLVRLVSQHATEVSRRCCRVGEQITSMDVFFERGLDHTATRLDQGGWLDTGVAIEASGMSVESIAQRRELP